jgi:hypothetical protein
VTGHISWSRFVRLHLIDAYLAQGWLPDGKGPLHAPHGEYSVWLNWPGPGEPPSPPALEQHEGHPVESVEAKN